MIEHYCDWCGEDIEDYVEVYNKTNKDFEIVCHKCFHESTKSKELRRDK